MAAFNEETAKKLLTQVEFYFSDSNLPRDDFLSKEVTKSKDGLVSLPLVCSFSRMRNLLGLGNIKRHDIPERIVEGVANLLRTSDFLKVSDDGQRIGRGTKLSKPEMVLEQVHRRTIAASPFEYSIQMEDVASFFSQFAKVNSVRLPHHIGDKRHFSGTALVEFSSELDTDYILRQSLVYAGADLVLIPKSDFETQRENTIKENGSSRRDSSYNEYRRGQLLKFTLKMIDSGENVMKKEDGEKLEGTDKSCASLCKESSERVDNTRENRGSVGSEVLKDVFQRFGSVKHIEYSGGLDSGYVCFIDSETATKALAAVEFAGGVVVKNKFLVTLEAVNGGIEREVCKRLSSDEHKGGGGNQEGQCSKTTLHSKKARKEH